MVAVNAGPLLCLYPAFEQYDPADDYVTPFGIREIKYNVTSGLTINGVTTKLKGACMHQMLVPAGSAVPDMMFERCIKELQRSGCTFHPDVA